MPAVLPPVTPAAASLGKYTFADLKAAVGHAIAGALDIGTSPARMTLGQVVNQAIGYLEAKFQWSWLRVQATFGVTQGSGMVSLPIELNEILAIETSNSTGFRWVRKVSAAILQRHQAFTWVNMPGFLYYMRMGSTSNTVFSDRFEQIAIAPIPTETINDALRVMYTRSIHRFPADPADTTQDSYVLDVPDRAQDAIFYLCRAFAVSAADQMIGSDWQLADKLLADLIVQEKRSEQQIDGAPESRMSNQLPGRRWGQWGNWFGDDNLMGPGPNQLNFDSFPTP